MRTRNYRIVTTVEMVNNRITRYALLHGFGPPWFAMLQTTGRRSGNPGTDPGGGTLEATAFRDGVPEPALS